MTDDCPIILLGGTNGAGKTTAAAELSHALGIHHRLGTGFIREIVRAEVTPRAEPSLFESAFGSSDPVAQLVRQSHRIAPAVYRCIDRAHDEGTSLVIEGNHLIPELYADLELVDLYYVLTAPAGRDEHRLRVLGESHSRRRVTATELEAIRTIDAWYEAQAARYSVRVVRNGQALAGPRPEPV